MTVCFHFYSTHQCLETTNIDLVLECLNDPLKIGKLCFLYQDSLDIWLVSLTMESLGHSLLVSFLIEFFLLICEPLLYVLL